jgi:hypothetical protein
MSWLLFPLEFSLFQQTFLEQRRLCSIFSHCPSKETWRKCAYTQEHLPCRPWVMTHDCLQEDFSSCEAGVETFRQFCKNLSETQWALIISLHIFTKCFGSSKPPSTCRVSFCVCFLWPSVPSCLIAFTHSSKSTFNRWLSSSLILVHQHPSSFSTHIAPQFSWQIPPQLKVKSLGPGSSLDLHAEWTCCLQCFSYVRPHCWANHIYLQQDEIVYCWIPHGQPQPKPLEWFFKREKNTSVFHSYLDT